MPPPVDTEKLLPRRRVAEILVLLVSVAFAICGLSGTYLTLTILEETEEYSLFDVWWADDAADILKRVGIDRIYYGLTVARTGAILSCLMCCLSILVTLAKTIFRPDCAISVYLFAAIILTVVSTSIVAIVWSEEFPTTHSRLLNLDYGMGYYSEIALGILSLCQVLYLCYRFHSMESVLQQVRLRATRSVDETEYLPL